MPVVPFPATFERRISSCIPDGQGFSVKFECGHVVWFAIDVSEWKAAHCSGCFEAFRTHAGKTSESPSKDGAQ
jgi:hypothetical protein